MGVPTGEKIVIEDIEYNVYVGANGAKYIWRYTTFGDDTSRYPFVINNTVKLEEDVNHA